MEDISIIIMIGLAVVGTMSYNLFHKIRVRNAWKKFAVCHGLQFLDIGIWGDPRIVGHYNGVDVCLYIEGRGAGKNRTYFTVIQVEVGEPVPPTLTIFHESVLSKIGRVFGKQDIQIGNHRLDHAFIIRSEVPSQAKRFLSDPGAAEALLKLYDYDHSMRLEKRILSLEKVRRIASHRRLLNMLTQLTVCANSLMSVSETLDGFTLPEAPFQPNANPDSELETLISSWDEPEDTSNHW